MLAGIGRARARSTSVLNPCRRAQRLTEPVDSSGRPHGIATFVNGDDDYFEHVRLDNGGWERETLDDVDLVRRLRRDPAGLSRPTSKAELPPNSNINTLRPWPPQRHPGPFNPPPVRPPANTSRAPCNTHAIAIPGFSTRCSRMLA
jgi:hypothetical protein